jgi:hypothetical protein
MNLSGIYFSLVALSQSPFMSSDAFALLVINYFDTFANKGKCIIPA